MRFTSRLIFILQFFSIVNFAQSDASKEYYCVDTLSRKGTISVRLGYFPYEGRILNSEGFTISSASNGEFKHFIDFGYYAAIYKGLIKSPEKGGLIFAGFNCAHIVNIKEQPIVIRFVTGFSVPSYPALTNILEIDLPLMDLNNSSSFNLLIAGGYVRFKVLLPVSISIGITF